MDKDWWIWYVCHHNLLIYLQQEDIDSSRYSTTNNGTFLTQCIPVCHLFYLQQEDINNCWYSSIIGMFGHNAYFVVMLYEYEWKIGFGCNSDDVIDSSLMSSVLFLFFSFLFNHFSFSRSSISFVRPRTTWSAACCFCRVYTLASIRAFLLCLEVRWCCLRLFLFLCCFRSMYSWCRFLCSQEHSVLGLGPLLFCF